MSGYACRPILRILVLIEFANAKCLEIKSVLSATKKKNKWKITQLIFLTLQLPK